MCNSNVFWGILILVFGLGIIIKNLFNLDISAFRITFGFALVLLGIKLFVCSNQSNIFKHHSFKSDNEVVFGNKTFQYNEHQSEYNVVFSSANLDFTKIDKSPENPIEVSCIFGDMKILINPKTKLLINSDVVFGKIDNPYENNEQDSVKYAQVKLSLKANAIFGNIRIIRIISKGNRD